MSKRMIDILLQDGCPIVGGPLQEDFREAEVLIVDNVSTYFYEDMALPSQWRLGDFPNCAPPYPLFWMETRTPQFGRENGAHMPLHRLYAWGALFFAADLPGLPAAKREVVYETLRTRIFDLPLTAFSDVKWWMVVIPMVQPFPNTDSLRDVNLQGHFLIQANGQMLRWKRREGTDEFAFVSAQGGRVKEDAKGTYVEMDSMWKYIANGTIHSPLSLQDQVVNPHGLLYPFWLAISFLHCKNVTTAKVDPCHPQGKRKASMQCQRAHYHVLNIHPMREILRREGNQESTGLKQALHICRGHFRDYTQGRGLFGKHQGLYWFDQHLRGSSTHGVVVKDYMIHTK
jgi:hypothetical protein